MPRFLQLLLGKYNAKIWLPIGLLLAVGIGIGYNRGESRNGTEEDASELDTPGVPPTREAGVLSQVGRLPLEIVTLRGALSELQTEFDLYRTQKNGQRGPVQPVNPCTERMRQELASMRAQLQANLQSSPQPAASASKPPEPQSNAYRVTPLKSAKEGDQRGRSRQRVTIKPQSEPAVSVPPDRVPYLQAQSIAEGRTIDGYTALAVEGEFPLTIEITTPFSLPDGSDFPVGNCRLGALGDAEELTARSRLALTQISCVVTQPNGDRSSLESPIEGYITARDNINGLIAEVFWHEREVIEAFGKAAVPAALVSLFAETRRVVEVASLTGVLTSTSSGVAEKTAERMVDIYLDKAEKLSSPIVWVPDNRYVNIYITKGAALKGLDMGRVAKRSYHEGFSR